MIPISLFLLFTLTISGSDQIWHGLDTSLIDKNLVFYGSDKRRFQLVFDLDVFFEIDKSGKKSSGFDLLPNELAKRIFDGCSKKDICALRRVTKNMSKRIPIFFDGRKDRDGNLWSPGFCLKTEPSRMYQLYKLLPGCQNVEISYVLVDQNTKQLCESMAAGRLQLGGHIHVKEDDYEGFKILANSLKRQKQIQFVFNEYGSLYIPQDKITFLLDTLTKGAQIRDLKICSLSIDDFVIPELVNLLLHNETLTKLTLYSTTITDEGIRTLAKQLEKNKNLKELDFCLSQNVTSEGNELLKKALHHDNPVEQKEIIIGQDHRAVIIYNLGTGRKLYMDSVLPKGSRLICQTSRFLAKEAEYKKLVALGLKKLEQISASATAKQKASSLPDIWQQL